MPIERRNDIGIRGGTEVVRGTSEADMTPTTSHGETTMIQAQSGEEDGAHRRDRPRRRRQRDRGNETEVNMTELLSSSGVNTDPMLEPMIQAELKCTDILLQT